MVTQRGIEANLKKIKAVLDMGSPKSKRDIKIFIGRIVTLSHFMSKYVEKRKTEKGKYQKRKKGFESSRIPIKKKFQKHFRKSLV